MADIYDKEAFDRARWDRYKQILSDPTIWWVLYADILDSTKESGARTQVVAYVRTQEEAKSLAEALTPTKTQEKHYDKPLWHDEDWGASVGWFGERYIPHLGLNVWEWIIRPIGSLPPMVNFQDFTIEGG